VFLLKANTVATDPDGQRPFLGMSARIPLGHPREQAARDGTAMVAA